MFHHLMGVMPLPIRWGGGTMFATDKVCNGGSAPCQFFLLASKNWRWISPISAMDKILYDPSISFSIFFQIVIPVPCHLCFLRYIATCDYPEKSYSNTPGRGWSVWAWSTLSILVVEINFTWECRLFDPLGKSKQDCIQDFTQGWATAERGSEARSPKVPLSKTKKSAFLVHFLVWSHSLFIFVFLLFNFIVCMGERPKPHAPSPPHPWICPWVPVS